MSLPPPGGPRACFVTPCQCSQHLMVVRRGSHPAPANAAGDHGKHTLLATTRCPSASRGSWLVPGARGGVRQGACVVCCPDIFSGPPSPQTGKAKPENVTGKVRSRRVPWVMRVRTLCLSGAQRAPGKGGSHVCRPVAGLTSVPGGPGRLWSWAAEWRGVSAEDERLPDVSWVLPPLRPFPPPRWRGVSRVRVRAPSPRHEPAGGGFSPGQ